MVAYMPSHSCLYLFADGQNSSHGLNVSLCIVINCMLRVAGVLAALSEFGRVGHAHEDLLRAGTLHEPAAVGCRLSGGETAVHQAPSRPLTETNGLKRDPVHKRERVLGLKARYIPLFCVQQLIRCFVANMKKKPFICCISYKAAGHVNLYMQVHVEMSCGASVGLQLCTAAGPTDVFASLD